MSENHVLASIDFLAKFNAIFWDKRTPTNAKDDFDLSLCGRRELIGP
jgi:hypothetical protein